MRMEPKITINGERLTEGQAMTFRVALETFALDITSTEEVQDKQTQQLSAAYMVRVNEIREMIFRNQR